MSIINANLINSELERPIDTSKNAVDEILLKARELKGISDHDVLTLLRCNEAQVTQDIFATANYVKNEIYGKRLVLFAPLYVSNKCNNECTYCAFRHKNTELVRRVLTQDEIKHETEVLINQGHKRVLLVAGEESTKDELKYVLESIKTVYSVSNKKGNIRRLNVNIAPLSVPDFKELFQHEIGTYQCFQETYHEASYNKFHLAGKKKNYQYRLETMDRAFQAGGHDLGVGVLFGLYDWRWEILALLNHVRHLEKNFGVGPHTISVPRIEPAHGSDMSFKPPYAVSDEDFLRIIAVLRMAVPYTGIILSTRENPQIRRQAFDLGVSQVSAGSKTNPGGYAESDNVQSGMEEQFSLGDTRSLNEVIKDIINSDHIPSFCTGCYRLGRVGEDFMDMAKPGLIKQHCLPNAIFFHQFQ